MTAIVPPGARAIAAWTSIVYVLLARRSTDGADVCSSWMARPIGGDPTIKLNSPMSVAIATAASAVSQWTRASGQRLRARSIREGFISMASPSAIRPCSASAASVMPSPAQGSSARLGTSCEVSAIRKSATIAGSTMSAVAPPDCANALTPRHGRRSPRSTAFASKAARSSVGMVARNSSASRHSASFGPSFRGSARGCCMAATIGSDGRGRNVAASEHVHGGNGPR